MKTAATAPAPIECVRDPARAGSLLSPLRAQILGRAREPRSATEIAAELGIPRQRTNYHVRELARAGFLRKAGRRKKRNLYEQRWRATAETYVIAPEALGPVGVDPRRIADRMSAEYLLALAARTQGEVARAFSEASAAGKRLSTLALDVDLRFDTAKQREGFTRALTDAVAGVVAQHASPDQAPDGSPGPGRPYRLVVGCHPTPPPDTKNEPEEV